jgi:HEAT repeat protein
LSDEDLEVVGAAVQYLGRHGSSAHVRDLIPLLSKESTDVGQAAAEAVYKLTREHLLENYNDLPVKSRESLTTLLTKLDKGFALSLIEEFRTADSEKKNNIISILELFHELDETVQEEILKMTDDPDSRVRATVARTLGRIQAFHDRYIAGLKLLYDEDARVRANAVEGATKDSPEFRERILELSEDGEPRERANAIRQLFVWQEPLASDRLDRFIADPSPNARLSVAWLLGELSFPLYETVLWDFVKDENPSIRIRAIKSLEKVAPDERIRELMFVFEDPEFAVRQAAREVIRSRLNLDYEEVD